MKSALLFLSLLLFAHSQTVVPILSQDFEGGVIPVGWRKYKNATAIGWLVGTTAALSSSFFQVPTRAGNVAVDNDDGCGQGCDGAFDMLDTPAFTQDPSIGETFVQFDSYYSGEYGQLATLAYSVTGMDGTYSSFAELPQSDPSTADWQTVRYTLPPLQAGASVAVRFWSSDDNGWAGGWAIDNVLIAQNNWTGVVPQCATLNTPTDGSAIPVSGGSISWTGTTARFPFGFMVSLGTDNPPTNIVNRLDLARATSYTLPTLQSGVTYYFQVVPYGKDRLEAVNCGVWSFVASLPPVVVPTAPYTQDFEGSDGGWVAGGDLSSWAYGAPNKTVIKTAHSGTRVWVAGGLTGEYNNNEQSWIQSPIFTFTNISSPIYVSFWVFSDMETSYDGVKFQYTTDSLNWNDLGVFGDTNWYNDYTISGLPAISDGWTGIFSNWRQAAHTLPNSVLGVSQVSFRFFLGSDDSIVRGGFAFDDFVVNFIPTTPPMCAENRFPTPGDDDLASKLSLVWARSTSEHPLLPLGMKVRFGSDVPPSNIFNDVDMANTLSLETPELTPLTTYYWQVVPYGFNGVSAVDCPVWSFTVVNVQASLPYTQDFESGEGGWAPLGNASSWTFGYPNKTTIVGCGSGSFCWVNGGLSGLYGNSENNYVLSPLFNFTALQYDPFIVLKVFWESEKDYDGANVQYQLSNGTWATVGNTVSGTNWYTSSTLRGLPGGSPYGWSGRNGVGSNRWVVANNELVGIAGKVTKIRIAFGSDISLVDDGFAFDDIKIIPAPVGVVPECASIVFPPNGAGNVSVPATFNLQWFVNSTVVGLPRGYYIKYGTTNPPTNTINTGILSTFPLVNVTLNRQTTYYWQIVPYGYNNLLAASCPVWSFTTVANPVYTSTSQPPTSTPTQAPTTPATSQPTSIPTSAPRTSTTPARSSEPPINHGSSSGAGGSNRGAVAAAVIIPILVLIVIIVVAVILYSKFSKKNRTKSAKLEAAERELDEKATKD